MISNPPETTKELFVPGDHSDQAITNYSERSVRRVSADNDEVWFTFQVPWDFAAITKAVLKCVAIAAKTNVNLDILAVYASDGEAHDNHTDSDLATLYDYPGNVIFEIDVAPILTNLAAGDNVGIRLLDAVDPGGELYIMGLEFRYG